MTSTKEFEVTVKQSRKEKQPLIVEFFFVIKGKSGRFRTARQGMLELAEGEGTATFSTSSKQDQVRYVYLGISERFEDRIEGWLVRAINREHVLGIAASSPSLEELASRPDKAETTGRSCAIEGALAASTANVLAHSKASELGLQRCLLVTP